MFRVYRLYQKQLTKAIASNDTQLIEAYEEELALQRAIIEKIYGAKFIENNSELFNP